MKCFLDHTKHRYLFFLQSRIRRISKIIFQQAPIFIKLQRNLAHSHFSAVKYDSCFKESRIKGLWLWLSSLPNWLCWAFERNICRITEHHSNCIRMNQLLLIKKRLKSLTQFVHLDKILKSWMQLYPLGCMIQLHHMIQLSMLQYHSLFHCQRWADGCLNVLNIL